MPIFLWSSIHTRPYSSINGSIYCLCRLLHHSNCDGEVCFVKSLAVPGNKREFRTRREQKANKNERQIVNLRDDDHTFDFIWIGWCFSFWHCDCMKTFAGYISDGRNEQTKKKKKDKNNRKSNNMKSPMGKFIVSLTVYIHLCVYFERFIRRRWSWINSFLPRYISVSSFHSSFPSSLRFSISSRYTHTLIITLSSVVLPTISTTHNETIANELDHPIPSHLSTERKTFEHIRMWKFQISNFKLKTL